MVHNMGFFMSGCRRGFLAAICFLLLCTDGQAKTAKPLPATLYVDRGDSSNLHLRTIVEELERALAEHREINFTPINQLLEPLGAQLERLSKADSEARAGQAHLNNLELEKGLAALQRAVAYQEEVFHLFASTPSGVEDHAWLLVNLAVGHFLAGDEQQARIVLQRACVLMPQLEFDEKKLPAQMRRLFDEVKFLVDELGTGDARIETHPSGAEVRANGAFVGFSPLVIRGLVAGRNLLSVSHLGYRSQTVAVQVEGGELVAEESVTLKPVEGNPAPIFKSALKDAQARKPSESLQWLAKLLQRKVIFLASLQSQGQDNVILVQLHVFDGRKNKVSVEAKATILATAPRSECEELVASLVPFLVERKKPRPKQVARGSWLGRFYRSSYFWPVVGAVAGAAVIGTSIGVGLYIGQRDDSQRGRNLVLLPALTHAY